MRRTLLNRLAVAVAAGAVAGCVAGGGAPPPLPALAADQDAPVLALFGHVLGGYFAGTGPNAPTTCATLSPRALTPAQEEALIVRFVRLAPAERCRAEGETRVDAITGAPAAVVEIRDFACASATRCSGRAVLPGKPAAGYAMRFENGAWRFTGDMPALAQ